MNITGYFIKDIRQYGELSEKIIELKLSNKMDESKLIENVREEYLQGLIKYYQ